jgi:hypothetical protein
VQRRLKLLDLIFRGLATILGISLASASRHHSLVFQIVLSVSRHHAHNSFILVLPHVGLRGAMSRLRLCFFDFSTHARCGVAPSFFFYSICGVPAVTDVILRASAARSAAPYFLTAPSNVSLSENHAAPPSLFYSIFRVLAASF